MARMPPERIATAREVSGVAALAERDRSLRRTADLAAVAGVSPRTLQRLFADYVGASPTWILRRYRLIDAAESGRTGSAVLWAEVAQDLGYADQAHLIRDFRAVIGTTPQAYADAQARRRDAPDSSAH
ncbi:MAG: helix-turn-helix domain-containing protein [Mycobacteriales bacterium]